MKPNIIKERHQKEGTLTILHIKIPAKTAESQSNSLVGVAWPAIFINPTPNPITHIIFRFLPAKNKVQEPEQNETNNDFRNPCAKSYNRQFTKTPVSVTRKNKKKNQRVTETILKPIYWRITIIEETEK